MRHWTIASGIESCGFCRRGIAADEAVVAVTIPGIATRRYRCTSCADGPVDWAEIEQERRRRAHDAAMEEANRPEPPRLKEPAPEPERPRVQSLPIAGLPKEVFDPRMAQTGERE